MKATSLVISSLVLFFTAMLPDSVKAEVEPNGDAATATDISASTGTWIRNIGVLSSSSDVDFYKITFPAGYDALYVQMLFAGGNTNARIEVQDFSGSDVSVLTSSGVSGASMPGVEATFTNEFHTMGDNPLSMDQEIYVSIRDFNFPRVPSLVGIPYSLNFSPVLKSNHQSMASAPIAITLASLAKARRSIAKRRTTRIMGMATHPSNPIIHVNVYARELKRYLDATWNFGPWKGSIPRKQLKRVKGNRLRLQVTAVTSVPTEFGQRSPTGRKQISVRLKKR